MAIHRGVYLRIFGVGPEYLGHFFSGSTQAIKEQKVIGQRLKLMVGET